MSDETAGWRDPQPGFRYLPDVISVSGDHQREKLEACGIDPALFGDEVDPSFFIGLAIQAGIRSGISAEGNVNMLQTLVQYRPARLEEPLRIHGVITAVTPVPRGRAIDTDVWFADAAGTRVIRARRRSLEPDAGAPPDAGAGARPAPVIEDVGQVRQLSGCQLTPERVRAYSMEGNSIHYDPVAAGRAGFRAPIIGGGMGVHYLTAEIWRRRPPVNLDVEICFRRPIFWDDEITVGCLGEDGAWRALCLCREGKILTEVRVNALD